MKKELKYESLARDLITLKEYFLEVKENFYASKCELESHLNELLKKINRIITLLQYLYGLDRLTES